MTSDDSAADDAWQVASTTAPQASLPCAVDEEPSAQAPAPKNHSLNPDTHAGPKNTAAADKGVLEVGGTVFHIRLHCTKRESFTSLTDPNSPDFTKMFIQSGRCDIMESLKLTGAAGPSSLAAVCGPRSLSDAVSQAAWKTACDFHAEEFAF